MSTSGSDKWISLKDAAAFCESEGIAKEEIQRGLIAGVIKGSGIPGPDRRSYTGVQIQLGGLIDWIVRIQLQKEGT